MPQYYFITSDPDAKTYLFKMLTIQSLISDTLNSSAEHGAGLVLSFIDIFRFH